MPSNTALGRARFVRHYQMTWVQYIESFAPVTVVAAVVLFVAKEGVEVVRRYRARQRKLKAIKVLLTEELERNYWALTTLTDTLKTIGKHIDHEGVFFIRSDATGNLHFRYSARDVGEGGNSIPDVHTEHFDEFLPQVAELDEKFFGQMREGYKLMPELLHIRDSLVAYVSETDPAEKRLDGFYQYGLRVLSDVETQIKPLYKSITGEELVKSRVR
jgi:hypothetical protein